MPPEVKKFLADALECAGAIEQFTARKRLEDLRMISCFVAVYYQFTIIGEALTQMRRIDDATFDRITESRRIVGFRNQVVHGYHVMKDSATWQIIQDKLPILRRELEQLLAE